VFCPIGLEMFLGRMGPIRVFPWCFFGYKHARPH